MQVQLVGNQNSNAGFGSKKQIEKASAFVNMDDSQLKSLAYETSINKKEEKKQQNSLIRTFCAIPIVDTIAKGILAGKNIDLSTRAMASGKAAGSWALTLGAIGLYDVAKKAITSNSKTLQTFQQDNPIASLVVDLGLIFGGFAAGTKGWNKLKAGIAEKYPEKIAKIKTEIFDMIDSSKLNKEILPKVSERAAAFAEKMPKLAKGGKIALANSMFILLGIALVKMIKHTSDTRKKIEHNYETLKNNQLEVAKYVANTMSVERDVLAQNQPILAKDLRHAMNKTEPTK